MAVAAMLAVGCVFPAAADDAQDGRVLVTTMVADAMTTFGGKTLPKPERLTKLHAFIDRYVDVELCAKDILGRYWDKATPAQQAEFKTLMVDYALGSWADYVENVPTGQTVEVTAVETLPNGRLLLHSMAGPAGDKSPVDWTVARNAGGRMVISDVLVQGVSIIRTMHADFTAIIRAHGGQVAPLLDAIKAKLASYQKPAN